MRQAAGAGARGMRCRDLGRRGGNACGPARASWRALGCRAMLACFLVECTGTPRALAAPTITLPEAKFTVFETHRLDNPCAAGNRAGTGSGVNLASGLLGLAALGVGLGPRSPALDLELIFNSASTEPSAWGRGCHSSLDETLALEQDGSLTWRDPSGAGRVYLPKTAGATGPPVEYFSPITTYMTLTATEFRLGLPSLVKRRDKDGTTTEFRRIGDTRKFLPFLVTDRNGNTLAYIRNEAGRLEGLSDVHGRLLAITYDALGRAESATDSSGRRTAYEYDNDGHRIGETDANGDKIVYAYDASHRVTRIAYPNGGAHVYAYDAQGRLSQEHDELAPGQIANRLTYEYLKDGSPAGANAPTTTVVTDALNRKTAYEHGGKHGLRRVTKVTDARNQATVLGYDKQLNLSRQVDALNRATLFEHDARGNVTLVTDALQGRTAIAYEDVFNHATRVTDPRTRNTTMAYDGKGNLVEVKDHVLTPTRMGYDAQGHVRTVTDFFSKTTRFGYDRLGALDSVTDPLTRTTRMTGDAAGRVTLTTDPKGKATSFAYDATGNLTRVTDAAGHYLNC